MHEGFGKKCGGLAAPSNNTRGVVVPHCAWVGFDLPSAESKAFGWIDGAVPLLASVSLVSFLSLVFRGVMSEDRKSVV